MKRITFREANYIMRRTKPHRLERLMCNWYIQLDNPNSGHLRCDMKWWAYLLFFIPEHVIEFFACIWDGGLRMFCFHNRNLYNFTTTGLTTDDVQTQFGRFKSVWEKNNAY